MSGAPATGRRRLLGEILKEMKKVNQGQIQEALATQREKGGQIGSIMVGLGFISKADLTRALATQAGMEAIDLSTLAVPPQVLQRVDAQTAQAFRVAPFKEENGVLWVALADPMNTSVLDDLAFMTGLKVKAAVAGDEQIDAALKKFYAQGAEDLDSLLDSLEAAGKGGSIDDPAELARSTPVVRLLNYILLTAVKDRSSDIHFEPFEEEFKIRYRVDGTLFELRSPPRHLATALISRVKVLADLDIAETRLPQDGRIDLKVGGRQIDLRVSTLPTMFGESCVLRVLDRTTVSLDLKQLGLRTHEFALVKDLIDRPHGIILVTGPTGSGKTTTLYSALNFANAPDVKIVTTEDPVEYDLDGVVQIQVNEEIGVGYAACLRSILRHDPDLILVGEIRDKETAQIAIEAALTGHLVFSTLHTNDAPSAVSRLIDVGVEPFLLSATLEAVVAQRLVRRVCDHCKTWYVPQDEVLLELNLTRKDVGDRRFAVGKGCEECHKTGYKGRMAIFEMMVMNEDLARSVVAGESTARLRDKAIAGGMKTLRDAGLLAVFDGATTAEEVVRETIASF
ncbi:MAG TPA: ATPase, T2SS/T4P/T4SS family [Planctomycetota bacterium]|nr:ATPase, T2SS/T4P/T4SS family [Planctomycetota bacterium]